MATSLRDRRGTGRRWGNDRGSMSVEVVLMTPLLVAFMLLVVAFGRAVAIRGEVEATTRDAVRAASLERDESAAAGAAGAIVDDMLADRDCNGMTLDWAGAGEVITLTVSCEVPYHDLGLIGLGGTMTVTAESAATLDLYRRSE